MNEWASCGHKDATDHLRPIDYAVENMRTRAAFFILLMTSACGAGVSPYARATAGRIGCPASQIELDQLERDRRGPQSWVAYCGRTGYACSSSGEPGNPRTRIVCSELGRPADVGWAHQRRHRHRH